MFEQVLLYLCIAGATVCLAMFLWRMLQGDSEQRLRSRLVGQETDSQPHSSVRGTLMSILQRISQAAAEPFMPKTREKQSRLRRDLGYAGIYSPSAVRLVIGSKFICLVLGLVLGYCVGVALENLLLWTPVGGLIGYLIPQLWLRARIRANQKALTVGLPDALDLMVVCVEAGLTIDSAMQRVGQELVLAHPAVSRELGITHMETRVGLSKAEALRNLGIRTGNAGFQSLAAMLIQAERFGTSIANALRVHAEGLRVKRHHVAEELAAKASVKLSFPLVLFIFPATFIVLAGPTVIGLMRSALFNE